MSETETENNIRSDEADTVESTDKTESTDNTDMQAEPKNKKSERDQIIELIGWILIILGVCDPVGNAYKGSNEILQFIYAALPWVLMGLGAAGIFAANSGKMKK